MIKIYPTTPRVLGAAFEHPATAKPLPFFLKSKTAARSIGVVLLLALFTLQTASAAVNIWNGSASTDWATAANWSLAAVPLSADEVDIPSGGNQPVIGAGTAAVAFSVRVQSGASLTINATGSLTINGSTNYGLQTGFLIQGTLNNNGTLTMGNTGSVGAIGFYNPAGGIINNNAGGQISIDNATGGAISLLAPSTFTNAGTITIGGTASVGIDALQNYGTFNNNTGGQISIDRSTRLAIVNYGGTFTNAGTITIGGTASTGFRGILNQATFNNNTGGQISIDRSTIEAIFNQATFINAATITIGGTASVGDWGILNWATFNNNTGGQISIDRSTQGGVFNETGTFNNAATITIGAAGSVGTSGIRNEATFNNTTCAAFINILSNNIVDNTDTFTNAGLLRENATGNSSITSNSGSVQNLNGGTFTIGTNTGILTTAIIPIWTGCTSTDWATASNWAGGSVPTATDIAVSIPDVANDPIIGAGTAAVGRFVRVDASAALTIAAMGSLTINGASGLSILNEGTVTNNGTITMGNISPNHGGIWNIGTFNNNTGGQIFSDQTNNPIRNQSGIFNNAGTLTFGATAGFGGFGIQNLATFNNNTGGQISIDRITAGSYVIYNEGSATFNNAATITLGATVSSGLTGIRNNGTFNNNTGGQISIDRSTDIGIWAADGTFTNAATITIGGTASVGSYGIWNAGGITFNNNTGGQISIDRSTLAGIRNQAPFNNAATITIGAAGSVGTYGIWNVAATFNNTTCAAFINIISNNNVENTATFTNAGLLKENATGNSSITSNSGIVQNLNGGTFTIGTNTGTLTTSPAPQNACCPMGPGAAPSTTCMQAFCIGDNPTVASLAPNGPGFMWYSSATGGSPLPAATALVNGGVYFVSQTVAGCESVRARVNVIVTTPLPGHVCIGGCSN